MFHLIGNYAIRYVGPFEDDPGHRISNINKYEVCGTVPHQKQGKIWVPMAYIMDIFPEILCKLPQANLFRAVSLITAWELWLASNASLLEDKVPSSTDLYNAE